MKILRLFCLRCARNLTRPFFPTAARTPLPLGRFSWFGIGSVTAAITVGLTMGVGSFTFVYAKGASYLGSDPAACANCHIMQAHYDAWQRGSHRSVAVCNDCHAPHTLAAKYFVKAKNGWNHSVAFTTGDFHEPIQITQPNRDVTEAQCRHCHQAIVDAIDRPHPGNDLSCIRCHRDVGHAVR
jgi:cytochrome c nitrite reductase small subunit